MINRSAQLKYAGGKSHCAARILRFAPSQFTEYRDPFCGNCPFLFHTDDIPVTISRWVNDLDWWVYQHYLALRAPNKTHV